MTESLPSMTKPAAFFIDFDGTLVGIVEKYDEVIVEPRVRVILSGLADRLDGAVAILSGRPLATIDQFLRPLVLPVAAEHGAVRRDAAGVVHRDFPGRQSIATAAARLAPFAAAHEGIALEQKESSVALHYRRRPELKAEAEAAARAAMAGLPDIELLPGKMVFEVKAAGIHKGDALKAFMAEVPFCGRLPVVIGDDRTDEDAFGAANALGGISIKIGAGETLAQYRTSRPAFLHWLAGIAQVTDRVCD